MATSSDLLNATNFTSYCFSDCLRSILALHEYLKRRKVLKIFFLILQYQQPIPNDIKSCNMHSRVSMLVHWASFPDSGKMFVYCIVNGPKATVEVCRRGIFEWFYAYFVLACTTVWFMGFNIPKQLRYAVMEGLGLILNKWGFYNMHINPKFPSNRGWHSKSWLCAWPLDTKQLQ